MKELKKSVIWFLSNYTKPMLQKGDKKLNAMSVEQLKEACNLHFLVTSVRAAAFSYLSFFNLISCSAITV